MALLIDFVRTNSFVDSKIGFARDTVENKEKCAENRDTHRKEKVGVRYNWSHVTLCYFFGVKVGGASVSTVSIVWVTLSIGFPYSVAPE